MSRFWVGGATGFLGAHLVNELKARGHEVVAVARRAASVNGVDVQAVDVLDTEAVAKSAEGCEGAFLAFGRVSHDPKHAEELHRLHVLGTRHALSGLRRALVRKVVVGSSSGTIAVGRAKDEVYDESSPTPSELIMRWPYYRTKYFGEREALEQNDPEGCEVVIANPSLLLGPGDERNSSTEIVRLFLEKKILATPAGGLAVVDVRDAARGMVEAFFRGRAGNRYILNGKNLTFAALFGRLERLTGIKAPLFKLPAAPELALGISTLVDKALVSIGGSSPVQTSAIELASHFWYCDSSKAERELGFSARDIGETLNDTVTDLVARKAAFPKAGFASVAT